VISRVRKADGWEPPIPSPDEQHRIEIVLRNAFADSAEDAAGDYGLDFDFIIPQAKAYGAERGAEMIGMKRDEDGRLIPNTNAEWVIAETTREGANALLRDALDEGWSFQDFASRLVEAGLFDEDRAELIARNEIALAMAGGKASSFREADLEYVVLLDEDGCGEDVCDVDGDVVTVDEYEANPLGHPNCTRDARPATREEIAEAGFAEDEEDSDAANAA
jgi:hypothetical protein